MDDSGIFQFNPQPAIETIAVGEEASPVRIIDQALADPASLVALAGREAQFFVDERNFYPGVRMALPYAFGAAFRGWLAAWVGPSLRPHDPVAISEDQHYFAVASRSAASLAPIQSIPHYDSTDPAIFAAILYLCDPVFGGTAFYRHRATGYERITAARQKNYHLALNHDLRRYAPPSGYIRGDTGGFKRIGSIPLRYNRLIIYSGNLLHAADIADPGPGPAELVQGRLTITTLFRLS